MSTSWNGEALLLLKSSLMVVWNNVQTEGTVGDAYAKSRNYKDFGSS